MPTTRRRLLHAGAAAALPLPAVAKPTRTLRFVPQANLTVLDPVFTTGGVTVEHGFLVFDTLYSTGADLVPRPQMAEGHTVSDDQRTWLIHLREGLRFHDGQPVHSVDCVASINRWSKRDGFGQAVATAIDTIDAADDHTIRIRLKRPVGALLTAMSHSSSVPLFIMPERLAKTDPAAQITEMIGSGPFRFLKDEYVSGSFVAYARFDGYAPRTEPADWTAGGKRVFFDRIEWHVIPDPATCAAALRKGEVDGWEYVLPDLVPVLSKDSNLTVQPMNKYGLGSIMRFNVLQPPFDKVAVRRTVLSAVDQNDYMQAIVGTDPTLYHTCYAMFTCGLPGVEEVGAAAMKPPMDPAHARQALHDAGYAGERVVILNPTDYTFIRSQGQLTADLLGRLGMNVDLQEMDWGTLLQRRTSRASVEKGGWSIFHTGTDAPAMTNPAMNLYTRGLGPRGYAGWFDNPEMERLVDAWIAADNEAERQRLFLGAQRLAMQEAPIVPLGLWQPRSAFRRTITGMVPCTSTLFWNLRAA
jgi:peptide/nickel transport system substrate-binding protein